MILLFKYLEVGVLHQRTMPPWPQPVKCHIEFDLLFFDDGSIFNAVHDAQ